MAPGKHLCSICSQWHSMHMPDNGTAVPFCKECWQKLSVNARAFAITQCRVATVIENLDRTIFEGIDGQIQAAMEQWKRKNELFGDN